MSRIVESKLDDVLASLPGWVKYQPQITGGLFILALGFEERAIACGKKWIERCPRENSEFLFIRYPTNEQDNRPTSIDISNAAVQAGITVSEIMYERQSFYGRLRAFFDSHKANPSITIDISAMSSYVIYPLLAALMSSSVAATLSIVYSEAKTYFPTKDEWVNFQGQVKAIDDLIEKAKLFEANHFQSKGVSIIYESPEFIGANPDSLPNILVVVPNFSYERVQKIIAACDDKYTVGRDPNEFEWIFGVPPDQTINGWRLGALQDMYQKPAKAHSASTFDYKDILRVLHDIWDKNRFTKSIVIGPLGSKAQHLGTFLFSRMHSEIAIVLAEPIEFTAERFSYGTGPSWVCEFGTVSELNQNLTQWNRIRFEWR